MSWIASQTYVLQHKFISGPRKECVNITIEHVENGAWTCCASAWDDMTGVIDSKTCVQQKLSCIGVRGMDCDLVCLDDPRNPHGILGKWYYRVNKNNKTWGLYLYVYICSSIKHWRWNSMRPEHMLWTYPWINADARHLHLPKIAACLERSET